jgi:hypothetical protein
MPLPIDRRPKQHGLPRESTGHQTAIPENLDSDLETGRFLMVESDETVWSLATERGLSKKW